MPSSDPITVPQVIKLVVGFNPSSILDIGCGNGRYGFLFREALDMNYGRMKPESWEKTIDGVEMIHDYRSPIHDCFYNKVYWEDWLKIDLEKKYDLVFMGDVLEHFIEGLWQEALDKALYSGAVVICVCPNWDGSINQGAVFGNESEKHRVVLSPSKIGGKCVWANTKAFITINSLYDVCVERDVLF